MKNIVSFSLWGDNSVYTNGMIENASLVNSVYPGWICRVYHDDSVPGFVLDILKRYGCELFAMPRTEGTRGMMWRFSVAFDDTVDRFIVRDADSRIGEREKMAVGAWIVSDEPYHVMRDHPHHGIEILGGMWGGTSGFVKSFETDYWKFYNQATHVLGADQIFLRQYIWPHIKDFHIAHDEFFNYTGRELPFPTNRIEGDFVGKPIGR